MMACDIEWTMLHIMMHCAPDPQNQIRRFNSDEMRMHNKIECTIADLKKYKPVLYDQYKDELEKLWEFKQVRNDLSHHKLLIEDNTDFKEFMFLFIKDGETGKEKLYYKLYTFEYLQECLTKFAKLEVTLAQLVETLKKDLPTP